MEITKIQLDKVGSTNNVRKKTPFSKAKIAIYNILKIYSSNHRLSYNEGVRVLQTYVIARQTNTPPMNNIGQNHLWQMLVECDDLRENIQEICRHKDWFHLKTFTDSARNFCDVVIPTIVQMIIEESNQLIFNNTDEQYSIQAKELLCAFNLRILPGGIHKFTPMRDEHRIWFKDQELFLMEQEDYHISGQHLNLKTAIFTEFEKIYTTFNTAARAELLHEVDFYVNTDSEQALNKLLSFLCNNSQIVLGENTTELMSIILELMPYCRFNQSPTAPAKIFFESIIDLYITGKMPKLYFFHFLHVIGTCGQID